MAGGVRYVAGRVAAAAGTLFVVSILVFVAVGLVPGNYADMVLGPYASPQARANLTAEFGLDQPLVVQYLQWLRHVVAGDLGTSLQSGQAVGDLLARRLPVTVELALLATLFAVVVGVPLAVAAGMARRRVTRGLSRIGGAVAMSTPDFVLGSILLFLFSRYSLGLQVSGYVPLAVDPVAHLRSMVLPAVTLGVFGVAVLVRTGRDAVAAVLNAPHVTAAIARGEPARRIVRHHVLRNASIPVLTVGAAYAGNLIGGVVIAENLFSLPGTGQLVLQSVSSRDYAIVLGGVLTAAAAFVVVNMLADFAYGIVDPRVLKGASS